MVKLMIKENEKRPLKRDRVCSVREGRTQLSPAYDSRKSFYNKAHVVDDEDGTLTLYSYNTPVCEIKDGKVKLLAMWDSSATTLRHVKEFLKQNGFEAGSKQSIAKMYGESVRRSARNRHSMNEETMWSQVDQSARMKIRRILRQYGINIVEEFEDEQISKAYASGREPYDKLERSVTYITDLSADDMYKPEELRKAVYDIKKSLGNDYSVVTLPNRDDVWQVSVSKSIYD